MAACLALSLGAGGVAAEPDGSAPRGAASRGERPVHWGLGAGGYAAITGSRRSGGLLEAELYPGGRLGRLGVRLESRGAGDDALGTLAAGVTFEGAASRPRLQIAVYATAGATWSGDPVIAAGAQTQLWLVGPLAVGLDGGAWLQIGGVGDGDTELVLGSGLTLRLAR